MIVGKIKVYRSFETHLRSPERLIECTILDLDTSVTFVTSGQYEGRKLTDRC
jgi:hypothetical protein